MTLHPTPRGSAGARVAIRAALVAAVLTIPLASGAAAQDTTTEEPPSGPPPEQTETGDPLEFNIDFGDSVTIDDEGNVIVNVETDTANAAETVVAPTPIPDAGIAGTGDTPVGSQAPADADAEGGEGINLDLNQSGSGNSALLVFAVIAASLAIVVAVFFAVRVQRARRAELAELAEPVDPLANEIFAGEFPDEMPEPAYAGATDAGAYEKGGAAYAQHTEPEQVTAAEGVTDVPENKLDRLRMSMVDMADKGLADAGHDKLIAKKLEAAGSQMRPGEWLLMSIAGTLGALFGATFVFGWILGIAATALVALGFWTALSFKEGRRQKQFADALPETLQLLAGSLRGGLSMMQAIQTIADEADEPTAGEFHRIVTETRLGRDLALSFRELSVRMDSKDFDWVVTAVEIHREVGGDLAAILDRVGNTIRARNRVRGQVQALSAEGKMSGLILFMLPPGMLAAIATLNRPYLTEMVGTTEGQIMLVVSGVLLLIGGWWLKRLARFVY
jgi:tight adherence protein B